MKYVHMTLQGKGGVGKSLVSSLIMQHLQKLKEPVVAVDTDPVNATFASYKAFNTTRLELMQDGLIIPRNFDNLFRKVIEEDSHFVIDNGAASFVPLCHYLVENETINLISEHGKQVIIHTVVTGGQAMDDTMSGFNYLVENMPETAQIVVWLNEFFGDIKSGNKTFEDFRTYQDNRSRVQGIIRIKRHSSSTFGTDIELMLNSRLTFEEVRQSPQFDIISKSRLHRVGHDIFIQMIDRI